VRRPGIAITAATGWAGVVAGHLAACFLTYPNAHARHVHLESSGHGWVGLAVPSLLAVIPVVLLAAAIRAVEGSTWSGSRLAFRLAAIQLPAFAVLELITGPGSERTPGDPAVFVGLALQPLVAVLSAWLLDLFGRAVRAVVVRRPATPRVTPRSFPRPALELPPSRLRFLLPARLRAPPLSSIA
jgi:hypothetical protein